MVPAIHLLAQQDEHQLDVNNPFDLAILICLGIFVLCAIGIILAAPYQMRKEREQAEAERLRESGEPDSRSGAGGWRV